MPRVRAGTIAQAGARPPRRGTLGVLGGMGPMATVDFYRKVVAATGARRDQEHVPVVVWADPSVPDRTAALTGEGPDPTPWLVEGARTLQAAGATVLAMPCNTAHAFLPAVRDAVTVPVLDMVAETCRAVARTVPAGGRVGVLATAGTIRAGLYQRALPRYGLVHLAPPPVVQQAVTGAISSIKAGGPPGAGRASLARAAAEFVRAGAEVLVAGCTELDLVAHRMRFPVVVVDSTSVLAEASVRRLRPPPE